MRPLTLTFRYSRIRTLRQALGLSRAELADRLDVTRQLVWAWEQGQHVPSAVALMRFSQMTGCKIESFFTPGRRLSKRAS